MSITREQAEKNIRDNPDIYFRKHLGKESDKYDPICPNCKKHELQVISKNKDFYACFTCGAYGDVFYFIGLEFRLNNFKSQLDKAIEIYWLDWISETNTFY